LLLPDEIRAGLKTRYIGKQVVCFKETTSTNDRAQELAAAGAPEGVLVATECQTQGRGRYQRHWLSKSHSNLLFSLVLRPTWTFEQIPMITLLLAVAVARGIHAHTGLPARVKWPNDILIQNGKVCGILTEMRTQADQITSLICGVGLNVNTAPSGTMKTKAVSLAGILGKPVLRVPLLQSILLEIENSYDLARTKGLKWILEQWPLLSCTPPGTAVALEIMGGERIEGMAMGIDDSGALLVRVESGITRRFASGEVQLQSTGD
jgi:BirA family biotin operon repressor/biotin-[acetyl-CoA-carboxylase] ligase